MGTSRPGAVSGRTAAGAGIGVMSQTNDRRDAPAAFPVRTPTRCAPIPSVPVENTRVGGRAVQGPPSIRYAVWGAPSALLKWGGSTWRYSCVDAVRGPGVPLTNSVLGAVPGANGRTTERVVWNADALTTLNENVVGSFSTTAVATSTRRR